MGREKLRSVKMIRSLMVLILCLTIIVVPGLLIGCSSDTDNGTGSVTGKGTGPLEDGGKNLSREVQEPQEAQEARGSREAQGPQRKVLMIAEQYGLAYAPLQVMRRRGFLEEELPGYGIEWSRLGNTAAIREAMLAGRLDAGFMGIPPFLIGYDRGMEWKIFSGLSMAPLGLVTWREDLRALEDFGSEDRIALPQPGSIQHILLSMACERELGDATALDDRLITMNHPDGMQSLLSRSTITAHFTSPPYLMEELSAPGMHRILSGEEAMGGDFTFIVGTVTDRLIAEDPGAVNAMRRALARAFEFIETSPREAVAILAEEYDMEPEKVAGYLSWDGLEYGDEIIGIETFINFMTQQAYLRGGFDSREVMYLNQ